MKNKKIDNDLEWESVLSSQKSLEEAIKDFNYNHPQSYMEDIYDFFAYTIPFKWNDITYEIKQKYQVLTRGYSDRNVWNMYYDVADLNIKLLTHLRDNSVGHPAELNEKKWNKILTKIIEGFQAVIDKENLRYGHSTYKKDAAKLDKKFEEGMELYKVWYRHLWD